MKDEFKDLGSKFKEKREELKLSLKEVENSTSIRSGYLEAIEEGKTDKFLTNVYMVGFMQQYGTFLGFNLESLSSEFPEIFQQKDEKHNFEYGIGTLEVRGSMTGGVKWLPNLVWAGVTAAALVLAWFLAKSLNLF